MASFFEGNKIYITVCSFIEAAARQKPYHCINVSSHSGTQAKDWEIITTVGTLLRNTAEFGATQHQLKKDGIGAMFLHVRVIHYQDIPISLYLYSLEFKKGLDWFMRTYARRGFNKCFTSVEKIALFDT
jgi:hypothetical protein